MLIPDLSVSLDGAHLVVRRRDGAEHSRFPVADLDAMQHADLIEAGASLPLRAWSVAQVEAALVRHGWRRTGPWRLDAACWGSAAVIPAYLYQVEDDDPGW